MRIFFRLPHLGFNWNGLFHLWQKPEVLGAYGWRSGNDRGVIFGWFCPVNVIDLRWTYYRHLYAVEARLLITHGGQQPKAIGLPGLNALVLKQGFSRYCTLG